MLEEEKNTSCFKVMWKLFTNSIIISKEINYNPAYKLAYQDTLYSQDAFKDNKIRKMIISLCRIYDVLRKIKISSEE